MKSILCYNIIINLDKYQIKCYNYAVSKKIPVIAFLHNDIKNLTFEKVVDIYKKYFWDVFDLDELDDILE